MMPLQGHWPAFVFAVTRQVGGEREGPIDALFHGFVASLINSCNTPIRSWCHVCRSV